MTLPAIAGIQEAVELGVTVFDVGCVVRHRTAVGERLAWLNQSVDLAAGARNCGAPENLRPRIVLVRFSLRRCAPSAVTLNYWQQAESQQVIVAQLNRQLEAAVSTIKESLTHPAAVRCVWVWEDWDLPPEANRQQRSARDQLFQVLRASIDQQGWLQGVAGMHWQSLAELAGSPKISVLQLHAGFGVLGPSREDSLVPICRVRGLGLLGTLPGYSGLLRSPLQLPPSHPATAPERKAAETARILAEEFGFEIYPTLAAGATPGGPVTAEAYEHFVARILDGLKAAPKLDGVLLALHGAMVAEGFPQADGETVRRVRALVGDLPIAVTHDYHANVPPELVAAADVLIVYKTNPHIDQPERGLQAAEILSRQIRGEVQPQMALVKPEVLFNIYFHNTSVAPIEARRMGGGEGTSCCSVQAPGAHAAA